MAFQLLYPCNTFIYGTCFEDAIKNFVKLNYHMNLTSLIAADQEQRYQINLRQYQADTRNRVGFDVIPYNGVLGFNTSPLANYRFWNPTASFTYNGIPCNMGVPYFVSPYGIIRGGAIKTLVKSKPVPGFPAAVPKYSFTCENSDDIYTTLHDKCNTVGHFKFSDWKNCICGDVTIDKAQITVVVNEKNNTCSFNYSGNLLNKN